MTGTAPERAAVELPKGGGALRGIGEKFAANPITGAAALSVPLGLPEARAGLGTDLTLTYDSTAGNGPFGFGWQVRVPEIARKTDKGIPTYGQDDGFLLSGAEDLVAVPRPVATRAGYAIRRFRPRIEGAFQRIERWTRLADGDVHWRTISKDNVLSLFGVDDHCRITDSGRTFAWLLHSTYDDRGNAAWYEYASDGANRYLKYLRYGNRKPLLLSVNPEGMRVSPFPLPDLASGGWMFEAAFDHGEGLYQRQEADLVTARLKAEGAAPERADPFSRHRAGFEVRTRWLCRGVLVFHHFHQELGTDDYLAEGMRFGYDETPYGSFLREVVPCGYSRQSDGRYLERTMPPLSCEYTPFELGRDSQVLEGAPGWGGAHVDLDGEGIAGVLQQRLGAWLYQPNLGGGRLAAAAAVKAMPVSGPAHRLADLAGDGALDLVEFGSDGGGFYERTEEEGWQPYRAFNLWPKLSWLDARMTDVTGDGLPDLLIARDDHLIFHACLGEKGFGPPVRIPVPNGQHGGPRVVFTDPALSIHLADMSGDGLPDIVRIRNGDVGYWPNLGHGHFGAMMRMGNAPVFDTPERFDAARIRFGDVDGTGVTDLVYLGSDATRLYLNEAGNAWSAPLELPPVPAGSNPVQLTDLLGKGTVCLVWSTPFETRYIDLMAAGKPHLLNRMTNGLGAEVSIEYESSTQFYLADKLAGTPWVTRLPFPVQIVSRVDRLDHIGQQRRVTRYAYRHGCFDGAEREWRGFARVDQWDTEEFGDGSSVPPVQTRAWYHTGVLGTAGKLANEFFESPRLAFEEPDNAEACRALKGQLLRKEVFAVSNGKETSAVSSRPYRVSEHSYDVKQLQHRVFFVHPRESLELHYERTLEPRATHELTVEVDDFGSVLLSASVAYGRRTPDPDPRLSEVNRDVQAETLMSFTRRTVTEPVDGPDTWRTPLPAETVQRQLLGVAPAGPFFTLDELRAHLEVAAQTRLLARERVVYRRNDLTGPLEEGQLESLALTHTTYKLALTAELAESVYPPGEQIGGGLVQLPGSPDYWEPSERVSYSSDPTATATAELTQASQHFFRERRRIDPFGNATALDYDPHDLFMVESRDALENVTRFVHNYRVLLPSGLTDPNGNRRMVAFDALGLVVGTVVAGKPGESVGDSFAGFLTDLTDGQIVAHLADPRSGATALLGRATTRTVYDLHAFARTGSSPAVTSMLRREAHDSESIAGPVRCQISYLDGSGEVLQEKLEAEDDKWITTGWVVRNNKGDIVRKYEPFFDDSHQFAFGSTAGVSPITCYDPLRRAVAEIAPDRSWRKVVFDPWCQETWDVNDTVLIADPAADPDVGEHIARLGAFGPTWHAARAGGGLGPAEQEAAVKAAAHAATPSLTAVDASGRAFVVVDQNGSSRLVLDFSGNHLEVIDTQGRVAARSVYDLLGRRILHEGLDSGRRIILHDVHGEPVREWDARGHVFTHTRDALRRVVQRSVRGTSAESSDPRTVDKDVVYERTVYGEGQPGDVAANLRTRVAAVHDGAGIDAALAYDFKGNETHGTRQFTSDHRTLPDWAGEPELEERVWHNRATFDALERPVTMTTPNGSVTRVSYSVRGLVSAVDVTLGGGEDEPVTFVSGIGYNARGHETELVFGNGARLVLDYDPLTARPVRVTTTRPSVGDALANQLFVDALRVQDLRYTHDPVGNITRRVDEALKTIFHNNVETKPVSGYIYDAIYRLIEATGRGFKETYSYDPTGNMKTLSHNGSTSVFEYSGNRLTKADDAVYAYDEHGSMTSAPHLPLLRWDFAGRLYASSKQVVNGTDEREITYYAYTPTGERVRKVTDRPNGTRKCARWYLRGSELFEDFGGDGTAVTFTRETLHVMAASRRVALVDNGVARYQFGDHLDTVTLELDESGALITYEEFTPYGATAFASGRSDAEVSLKRYRFTGREKDEETGFQYHGARYYAPWLARWTTCDPAGLVDGPNLYLYAQGNPIRLRDPTGTQATAPPVETHRITSTQKAQTPAAPAAKPEKKYTSTPPANRPATHLRHTPGIHGDTKMEWQHWPGARYDVDTGKPKGGWTWLTVAVAGLFMALMTLLMVLTRREDRPEDPKEYNYVRWGFTGFVVALGGFRILLEETVSKTPEGEVPAGDRKVADPWWTTIHTSFGVLMGIWQVPFPLVMLSTILWEGVEITAPGFGDHEINGNRLMDIGVAWAGWLVASSITAAWLKAPWPHGFAADHYTRDRGQPRT
jgi:RHS repeat-associated protein